MLVAITDWVWTPGLRTTTFDHGSALLLHAVAANDALATAENGRLLRDDIAFDVGSFLDDQMRSMDVAVNAAEDLQRVFADNIAGHQHAVTKNRNRLRRCPAGYRLCVGLHPAVAGVGPLVLAFTFRF